jgi:peptide/nickel transport system permease protein
VKLGLAVQSYNLKRFLLRRAIGAIPLVFGVIVLTFTLIHMVPGDVLTVIAGEAPLPEAQVIKIRSDLGLDRPLYEQLFIYVTHILQGDLGYSFISRAPVLNLILNRLPFTLLLTLGPMIVASILGVILGVVASCKQYSLSDNAISTLTVVGFSVPVFWMGQLLIQFFSLQLGLLPAAGLTSLRASYEGPALWLDILWHLVLPAITLGMLQVALVTRLARASMLESLTQDYIVWARAKGLPENTVVFKHALKNALLPVTTLVGYQFGYLLTGAVLIETVFAWPGLGRLLVNAVFLRDFPVMTGLLIFVSFMVIVGNLITDVAYALLDPRIRYR